MIFFLFQMAFRLPWIYSTRTLRILMFVCPSVGHHFVISQLSEQLECDDVWLLFSPCPLSMALARGGQYFTIMFGCLQRFGDYHIVYTATLSSQGWSIESTQ